VSWQLEPVGDKGSIREDPASTAGDTHLVEAPQREHAVGNNNEPLEHGGEAQSGGCDQGQGTCK